MLWSKFTKNDRAEDLDVLSCNIRGKRNMLHATPFTDDAAIMPLCIWFTKTQKIRK